MRIARLAGSLFGRREQYGPDSFNVNIRFAGAFGIKTLPGFCSFG